MDYPEMVPVNPIWSNFLSRSAISWSALKP